MSTPWHADDDVLAAYTSGRAGALAGASLEQHLGGCATCRARIARHVAAPALQSVWAGIVERAQAPSPTWVERLLVRLGLSERDALLVAVAPSLRTSWLCALAASLMFVGLSAGFGGTHGLAVFLLVAPLVPVVGVACAYGPDVDPTYEAAAATPYSAERLLLLRTAAVLVTCLPLVLGAALLLPALSWTALAWLLPALALTAVVLTASTWARPSWVGGAVAAGWMGAVGSSSVAHDPAAVLAPALLLIYVAVGLAAAVVLLLRLRLRHLTLLGSLP